MREPAKRDRRIERTRGSILSAFRALLLERGFENVTVRDVIERANVGRSTFYEHFQSKDDVLYDLLAPVMTPLADALGSTRVSPALRFVIEHVWENREASTLVMLAGPSRSLAERFLATLFEERLAAAHARARRVRALLPRRLAAAYLADAQLGLVIRWISASERCSVEAVAEALVATTNAGANALFAL